MCTEIFIGEEEISTVGELKAKYIVLSDDLAEGSRDEDCLCGTDVQTVLDRAGVSYKWDPFGYQVIE
jgi:molybdopterin converting factor small subunit